MSARCKPSGSRCCARMRPPRPTHAGCWSSMRREIARMVDIPAHVARQYLGNLGKIDNGVVSVTSLWADERVYDPLETEPYTPESYFPKGKNDPNFRTKLKIAWQLVQKAVEEGWPFRAMVADTFYGEDRGLKRELRQRGVPYVMALKPSHAWYHPEEKAGTLQDVAHEAGWQSAEQAGKWGRVIRTFRDGSTQEWWAL